jgi:Mu transposase, C-terminal
VRSGLVAFEVNRKEYEYAFAEYYQHVHLMMKGYKVKVYYDETDMSSVDIFGENDQYIATLRSGD